MRVLVSTVIFRGTLSASSSVWRDTDVTWLPADVALTQRLEEELKFEVESAHQAEPDFLKAFKAQGTWAVSREEFCRGGGKTAD